jgi:acetylornithine aminotransferase
LTQIRQICDDNNWLLIIDEVQTGVARTGKWFCHQFENLMPDVMTLAKGLGSGVPVGALLTHGRANNVFHVGAHGTTFGGNPLAMSAGLATIATIDEENLLDNAARQGQAIKEGLRASLAAEIAAGNVCDIRGRGLMVGIELDRPCTELVGRALQQGLLLNVTHDTVVRLLPPLIINDDETAELVRRLTQLIKGFLHDN